MTAEELIELLKTLDPKAVVRIWPEDDDEYMPVTGAYNDDEGRIELSCV